MHASLASVLSGLSGHATVVAVWLLAGMAVLRELFWLTALILAALDRRRILDRLPDQMLDRKLVEHLLDTSPTAEIARARAMVRQSSKNDALGKTTRKNAGK